MPISQDSPVLLAPELAKLLEADPIATGQVKEHLSAERLMELLNLTAGDLPENDYEDLTHLMAHFGFLKEDALGFVVSQFSRAEILAALNGD